MEPEPFEHLIIDNALPDHIYDSLKANVLGLPYEKKVADLFSFSQSGDVCNEPSLQDWFTYIEQTLSKQFTFSTYDCHATLYEDTDFLLCHDDQLDTRSYAYLLYCSTLSPEDGGGLALYNNDGQMPTTIAHVIQPKENRLVIFKVSPLSFHAVQEVIGDKKRYTLGGWLH